MPRTPQLHGRRLAVESLEDRRLLATASFSEVSAAVGITGLIGGSGEFHGGGLVFTDLNEDGYADLYLIGPSSRGNRLYVNVEDGVGGREFSRVAGDGATGYGLGNSVGAVAADYDNDGDLDLYLTNYRGPNVLYKNLWYEDHPDGIGDPADLRFQNVTALTDPTPADPPGDDQHGLGWATYQNPDPTFGNDTLDNTMSAAWADVNRDGWVDLYVGSWDGTNGDPSTAEDGQLGERDTLYLNNGDGTFTDITMGGRTTATLPTLLDDGGFELATSGTLTSNSDWTLVANAPNGGTAADFRTAAWASSDGATGIWFKAFTGRSNNPANASVTQSVVAEADGTYSLDFDARVETNFAADHFRVTLSSDGAGGGPVQSQAIEVLDNSTGTDWLTHRVTLEGVQAGDRLTIVGEMVGGAVPAAGPQQSAFLDAFVLRGPAASDPDSLLPVGGWESFDGAINDPTLPAEFSGQNGLQFADFNNDGWQDLIVATMGGGGVGPNRDMLYLNRGNAPDGRWLGYELASYTLGFGGNESSDMGVAVADIDNDGDLDYFSTILPDNHPLWINTLSDSGELGFTQTSVTNTFAWGANFHDFDNNGRVDLLVGTEVGRPSFLHLQELDGTLNEQAADAGLTSTYSTRGVAVADLDRDGYSDAALWSINAASPGLQLYNNDSASTNADHHFLTLELEGDPTLPGTIRSTRDAIGARAYVTADFDGDGQIEADETRIEEVLSGHSNGATTSSLALEFGLGLAERADVRIVWGSGRTTTLHGVAADQFLAVTEQAANVDVLVGDFNGDRRVDAADYPVYRDTNGTSVAPFSGADANGDGQVTTADAATWRSNYGLTAPQLATVAAANDPGAAVEASTIENARNIAFVTIAPATNGTSVRTRFSPTPRDADVRAEALALLLTDDAIPERGETAGTERTELEEPTKSQVATTEDTGLDLFKL